ncbi:DUF2590 family protein [Plesiomonas shigelloides]|uniref:DUF2590 family protein n=1 Tax=Plesiomonas shigelloides TaxID=703 RepID=A0A8I1W5M9_PLESH|nr:DUF2590 family protein [Plesiomonas shigelloides]MBO1107903.1 DUF2590 family protein [Plesiomonas shigelloides]
MSEGKYIDLLITDGDITLDSGREPIRCNNRNSIAQDIVHAILESGLGLELVGERSPTMRADVLMQIMLLVEDDERLIPGTIEINDEAPGRVFITADTYEFGPISTQMDVPV